MGLGKLIGYVAEIGLGALAEGREASDKSPQPQVTKTPENLSERAIPSNADEKCLQAYLVMATDWISVRRMEIGLPPIEQLLPGASTGGAQHPFAKALSGEGRTAYINFVPPRLVVDLEHGESLTASMPPGVASVARAINQGKYPELVDAKKTAPSKPIPPVSRKPETSVS